MRQGFLQGSGKRRTEEKKVREGDKREQEREEIDPDVPACARARRLLSLESGGLLQLHVDRRYGRLARLSRSCQAGSLLLRSENYCTVVADEHENDICSHCMKGVDRGGGARCSRCTTLFCEEACLEAAGPQHTLECSVLCERQRFKCRLLTDDETVRLVIRSLSRKLLQAEATLDEIHFDNIAELLCHDSRLQDSSEFQHKVSDARNILSWFPPVPGSPTPQEVARLMLRIKFNAHPITNGR